MAVVNAELLTGLGSDKKRRELYRSKEIISIVSALKVRLVDNAVVPVLNYRLREFEAQLSSKTRLVYVLPRFYFVLY